MRICSLKNLKAKNTDLDQYFQANSIEIDPLQLYDITGKQGWFIGNPAEFNLKKKIETNGKPLKDWDIKIYKGLMTGCNEAFYIDKNKKDELIAQDPKSAEIIKPILRGRDIKRYSHQFANLYLLFIPWHFPLHKDPNVSGNSLIAKMEFEKQYPAIYDHLLSFKDGLSKRNKSETGIRYEWYALQRCANTYYDQFSKEKVVWAETGYQKFAFVSGDFVLDKTLFMIVGNDLKYIMAICNSKIGKYIFDYSTPDLGSTGNCMTKQTVETIPIPILDTTDKQELARQIELIVEQILLVKSENPHLEGVATQTTGVLEAQIDRIVYQLYGLTEDEIGVVEN